MGEFDCYCAICGVALNDHSEIGSRQPRALKRRREIVRRRREGLPPLDDSKSDNESDKEPSDDESEDWYEDEEDLRYDPDLVSTKGPPPVDRDLLYKVMAGLSGQYSTYLEINYGPVSGRDQFWEPIPGEEFSVTNPNDVNDFYDHLREKLTSGSFQPSPEPEAILLGPASPDDDPFSRLSTPPVLGQPRYWEPKRYVGHGGYWPEDEMTYLDLNGAYGERIVEIGVSKSGTLKGLMLKTNRERFAIFGQGEPGPENWTTVQVPDGDFINGIAATFDTDTNTGVKGPMSSVVMLHEPLQ
ncbi:hypothetical protein MRS44_017189 [Fusarium solani]|uniref:uncharacterized protein n=1 Tax=Fusarium solani TaxID=169388 RepID=UPI0032C40A36|nr:hypothetical protein MRS44_017189 [Fusarium solani]